MLHGWGGDALLRSYDAERRPVAQTTTAAALTMWEALHSGAEQRPIDSRMLDMGYEYGTADTGDGGGEDSSADTPLASLAGPYRQSARAGARAPHVWLGGPGARRSTLDLFGHGFTLLTGSAPTVWRVAAGLTSASAAPYLGNCSRWPDAALRATPLAVTSVSEPEFADVYELGQQGAVLVRPDGHVAARWHDGPRDVVSATRALAAALSMSTGSSTGSDKVGASR